ncbi:MaoC family dehydratase [Ferrimonas gelatinilytica]|uniref:MaoC/PaaZ C-terminal domain-containing protein n=1 Tax=Ferrimonas gelatinilytica TaxID=1255257 RepID=A0ABP9RUW6_9GAMM
MQQSIRTDQIPSNLTLLWKGFTKRCDNAELPDAQIEVANFRLDPAKLKRYNAFCGFESGALPLSFPFVATQPLQLMLLTDPDVPVKPLGMIHMGVRFVQSAPMDTDSDYRFVLNVGTQQRTDAGLEFELVGRFFGAQDQEVAAYYSRCLLRMPPPENSRRRRPARTPRVTRDWQALASLTLDTASARGYAKISGDYNPIHLHRFTAKPFGFDAPIAHGMYMVAKVLSTVKTPLKAAEFDFKRPALLPISATVEGEGEALRLVNEGGKPLLEGQVSPLEA